ncbi:MAG: hypothetical protein HQ471_11165 [Flavobacteriales bacterium]|jgi:Flp pilus assembly protein TadB|nr:hypothetical protein [Flavobacteriales bacterium]
MLGNFFKQRSHYVYNYKPRFYNARKERLEAVKNKYKDVETEETAVKMATNFREAWKKSKKASSNNANLKTAFIIAVLVFMVYNYFKYLGISFF